MQYPTLQDVKVGSIVEVLYSSFGEVVASGRCYKVIGGLTWDKRIKCRKRFWQEEMALHPTTIVRVIERSEIDGF